MIAAMTLMVALAAQPNGAPPAGQPASRPASQPAQLAGGGTGDDVQGEVTFIFELDERRFKVRESWSLTNQANKLVDHLTFEMPKGTFRLTLDEDVRSFASNEPGTAYGTTGPLGPGQHNVAASYFLSFSGDATDVARRIPVNMVSARLIIEDVPGLGVSANVPHKCEPRSLNGLEFKVCTFDVVNAGRTFEVRFRGLPSRPAWPRWLAVLISLGFVGWMGVMLAQASPARPSVATTTGRSPVSALARRDQIVRALELLAEDHASMPSKRYKRRYNELMEQLADVEREIELAKAAG